MNSTTSFWEEFKLKHIAYQHMSEPQSFYFCDNKIDADECAELVMKKIKQATSPSVWWFDKFNLKLPAAGDLAIVTDWNKQPKAIIRTKKVEIVKYKDITAVYAFIEGEGDRSLAYWEKVHWDYYKKERIEFDEHPDEQMEIVCEYFETLWPS